MVSVRANMLRTLQALSIAAAANVQLPEAFLAIAESEGIKRSAVLAYISLQNTFFAGWLARAVPWFRDRLIYDRRFLFKVGAEIAIDSGCATFAEVRKRGSEFWDEFEFYLSDLLVGLVMDVALVGLMAPVAVLGAKRRVSKGGASSWLRQSQAHQRKPGASASLFFVESACSACVQKHEAAI
jgi:Protein RETICULATA-related